MAYTVTAPLVVAHTESGDVYVYEGGSLPEGTDGEQVKQLLDTGMVEQEKKAASTGVRKAKAGEDS